MSTTPAGTTNPKRKRITKQEKEARRLVAAKEEMSWQQTQEEISRIVAAGGRRFEVHWKKNGRWHAEHTVVVTKMGQIFFPDHGMCNAHALIAEVDLTRNDKGHINFQFAHDSCHALAFFLLRPNSGLINGVPFVNSKWRMHEDKNGMTIEQKKWWSADAFVFIQEIVKKRGQRSQHKHPIQDPVTRGIPFIKSVHKRIDPIRQEMDLRLRKKIDHVKTAMLKDGHSQVSEWGQF
jgi:hypothetical protein